MSDEMTEAGGLPTRIRRAGRGSPVIVLHGFTGSVESMAPLASRLAPHHTVLSLDLVGHGPTEVPASVEAYRMERAVAQLMDVAAPLDQPAVVGYSMGGRVALSALAADPDMLGAVAVIGAHPGIEAADKRQERQRADGRLADLIERRGVEWFVDEWLDRPFFRTQRRLGVEHLAAARAQRLKNDPIGLASSLRGMGTGSQEPVWAKLAGSHHRLLYVVGAEDPKFEALGRRLADKMAGASLAVVADAGHAVHEEKPDSVSAVLLEFFVPQ